MAAMNWPGAVQKTGTLSRIETYKNDIRPVVLHTHTFVLKNADGRADERYDLFYTGLGATPEEAETTAEMVYLRSTACKHQMVRKNPTLLECRSCGIQQRILPGQAVPAAASDSAVKEPERKPGKGGLFGFLRKS